MKKELSVFPTGSENRTYAEYFTGMSYLNMLSTEQVPIGNVTFEPGCRNEWCEPMSDEEYDKLKEA